MQFSFLGRQYQLKLEWGFSLVFIAIFLTCCALAFWQLERAEQYSAEKTQLPSLSLTGHWSNAHFLLDNRTHNGKVGYYQIGLFNAQGSQSALMVNLGWLPAPVLRTNIPTPSLAKGLQSVKLVSMPFTVSPNWNNQHWPSPKGAEWPKRMQAIDHERMALLSELNIEEGLWLLTEGREKKAAISKTSSYLNKHRHYGYALQWFLIGIAALAVWLANGISRFNRESIGKGTDNDG